MPGTPARNRAFHYGQGEQYFFNYSIALFSEKSQRRTCLEKIFVCRAFASSAFLHKKAALPTGEGSFCGDWGRLWGRCSSGCSSGCRSRCWCGCSCGQKRRSQGGQRSFGRRRSWSFGGQRSPFYHNIFGSGFSAGSYGDGVGSVCKSFVGRGHKQHGLRVAQNFSTAAAPFKCGSRVGRGEAGHKNYIVSCWYPQTAFRRCSDFPAADHWGHWWAVV